MMSDRFWDVVEGARARAGRHSPADPDEVADYVVEALTEWSRPDLVALGVSLDHLDVSAYRWDLWGAAFLITGDQSEEGFEDFRGWLVAQGRSIWDEALNSPDSLAELVAAKPSVEAYGPSMWDVAVDAYALIGGTVDEYWNLLPDNGFPDDPAGLAVNLDDSEALRLTYPRLSSLYRVAI